MSSYSKIVFGLKHHQMLSDCRTFMEMRRSLNIIISEHNAVNDFCERPGLHYHGIIEHGTFTNLNNIDAIVQLKTYCAYFKVEKCNFPEQFVLDLKQPPKQVMVLEIWESSNLSDYYLKTPMVAGFQLELSHHEIEFTKLVDLKSIMHNMQTSRIFDPMEICKQIDKETHYFSTADELKSLVMDSIGLMQQKILDHSILKLCDGFLKWPENYFSVQDSVDLIMRWCHYQNILVEEFTMNWIKCLDKQVPFRNSLYFQGSAESGVNSIVDSIAEACYFIAEIDNECTGYFYVWEECIEKRCIIMHDPVFDERMFEELESILSGIGTFVPHQKNTMIYIRPTPVIVIDNKNYQENGPYLQRLQNSFLQSYVNLKPFVKLHKASRRLHPDWLKVLYKYFTDHKINSVVSSSEHTLEINMDSELSSDEFELINELFLIHAQYIIFCVCF